MFLIKHGFFYANMFDFNSKMNIFVVNLNTRQVKKRQINSITKDLVQTELLAICIQLYTFNHKVTTLELLNRKKSLKRHLNLI